ncbi:MAG: hypothetical protein P4L99_28135 [Chthoniobacter sp.]|nr:hypothetical protein [Chthoniobacter sp.]
MIDFPEAHPGQELTPSMWNQARAFVRRWQLFAGPGIRLKWDKHGTIISALPGAVAWDSPFKCALRGTTGASVATGWINGSVEPEIKSIPLSGDAKHDPPLLEWTGDPKLAPDGTGFIAVEVTCDDKWILLKEHAAQIIQCAYLDRDDGDQEPAPGAAGTVPLLKGRRARWGLARLKKQDNGQIRLFQVTLGDLQFKPQPKSATSEEGRAFFY